CALPISARAAAPTSSRKPSARGRCRARRAGHRRRLAARGVRRRAGAQLLEVAPALQHLEPARELDVALLAGALGARLGAGQFDRGAPGDRLALGLAVARPLEVALEVALAQRAAASALERVAPAGPRLVLLAARGHRDVGRDADLLDRATRRRVVERGGEAQAR